MELVTPLRHLLGMEAILTVVLTTSAVVAGLLLVAAGAFSVLSLFWGDLLEREQDAPLRQAHIRS